MEINDLLKDPYQRLKIARTSAGYKTAKSFYETHGIPKNTYIPHENGRAGLTVKAAKKYADLLNVSPGWLLTGESLHKEAILPSPPEEAQKIDYSSHSRSEYSQRIHGPDSINFLNTSGLTEGMTVLDAGCGNGIMTRWLANKVGPKGKVIAIDILRKAIDDTKYLCNNELINNVEYKELGVEQVSSHYKNIDFIYCRFVLSHNKEDRRMAMLSSMFDALRPGGILVVEDANHNQFFHFPPSKAFARAIQIHMKWAETKGADYNLGDKLYTILKTSFAFENFIVRASQPVVINPEEKRMIEFVTDELREQYCDAGICDDNEISTLVDQLRALARDPTSLMGYTRVTQVRAIKG